MCADESMMQLELSEQDLADLRLARSLLETPSLAARLSDAVGAPIERDFQMLPEKWSETVNKAVKLSLERALNVAVRSLRGPGRAPRNRFHRLAVAATGAGGGAFGLPGLVVELPLSTTLMLRSIADIAMSEGEDLQVPQGPLACMEVFALGGRTKTDDASETGYFAVRSALASTVTDAARYLSQKKVVERGAPALVRFISAVSTRFGIVVSEKAAAMAIPAIGAAGGALVNTFFINHFQNMARGHFIIRRLERTYGAERVRRIYEELPGETGG